MKKRTPATFGDRLKALRESAGLSRYALAKQSGVSEPGLRHFEMNERMPRWDIVQRIRLALGCSFEDLADRSIKIPGAPKEPAKRGRPKKGE